MKKYPIMLFLILLLPTVAFASSPPADWWGKVTIINGISNGATVSAYVNGELRSTAVVGALKSDYYLIHVEGQSNDIVYFKVNSYDVSEPPQNWSAGDHSELDFAITIPVNQGDNQQKQNGGGGGESTSNTPDKKKPSVDNNVPNTIKKSENIAPNNNNATVNGTFGEDNVTQSQSLSTENSNRTPTGRFLSNTSVIGGVVVLVVILIGAWAKFGIKK